MMNETPRMVSVHLQTDCEAEAETVWRTLVDDIDSWWGEPYVSSDERQSLTLDAKPGGLLFEDWGDGNGTTWATIRALRRPQRIEFDGTFMMTGALHGTVGVTLKSTTPGTTRISLTQQAIGAINDETVEAWTNGWNDLLNALKHHSEWNKGAHS